MLNTARPFALNSEPHPSFKKEARWVVMVFLIWRGGLTVWAGLVGPGLQNSPFTGHSIFQAHTVALPSAGPVSDFFLAPWYRWDAGWYLKIATLGYAPDDGSRLFPPLYPLLIRLLAPLTGANATAAGLIISSLCALGMLLLLRRYLWNLEATTARWVILLIVVFPTSFFFVSIYTEALYLLLALAALLAARGGHWLGAGLCALLAGLTRLQALALAAPLAVFWWQAFGPRPSWHAWPKLLAVVSAPLNVFLYLTWAQTLGNGSASPQAVQTLGQNLVMPWEAVGRMANTYLVGQATLQDWSNLTLLIIALGAGVALVGRWPTSEWVYAWAHLLTVFVVTINGSILLRGVPRYLLVNFPLFVLFATFAARYRRLRLLFVTGGLGLQLLAVWLYTHWVLVG